MTDEKKPTFLDYVKMIAALIGVCTAIGAWVLWELAKGLK